MIIWSNIFISLQSFIQIINFLFIFSPRSSTFMKKFMNTELINYEFLMWRSSIFLTSEIKLLMNCFEFYFEMKIANLILTFFSVFMMWQNKSEVIEKTKIMSIFFLNLSILSDRKLLKKNFLTKNQFLQSK